jgi:hypothetical protein
MKTKFTSAALLAVATVLGFDAAPALAAAPQASAGYVFPDYGVGAPERQAPVPVPNQTNGSAFGTYLTESGHGTWLFPPDSNGNG